MGHPSDGVDGSSFSRVMAFFWYLCRRLRAVRLATLRLIRYTMGLDVQDRLMCWVKWLPATVGGFLTFTYVYAGSSQRYRRTYLAVAVWYTTLSWSSDSRVSRWWQRRRRGWVSYTWLSRNVTNYPRLRLPETHPNDDQPVPLVEDEPVPSFFHRPPPPPFFGGELCFLPS